MLYYLNRTTQKLYGDIMGHYDSCYEYEAEVARKKLVKEYKEISSQASELRHNMKGKRIPDRFKESLDDLVNWLNANS